MPTLSAGILLFKWVDGSIRIFLVHPGGPFYVKKDIGAWSIPKGEFSANEDALVAAIREFHEETGFIINGNFITLNPVNQSKHKTVYAYAAEGEIDSKNIHSNTFKLEWPPKSGRIQEYPEIDEGEWFTVDEAKQKILKGQISFIDQLLDLVKIK
jgi:predicted NUDIX family NTP pyrophosphohydrolase